MNSQKQRSLLQITGACENNLKNVALDIPFGQISCIAGMSGSGKSSLVEGCIVEEAARRYQALKGRSNQFPLPYRPDIDSATLPFTILVSQGVLHWNARSTVGTASGIIQSLRSIFLPIASVRAHSGEILSPPNAKIVAEWLVTQHNHASVTIMALIGRRILGPLGPRIADALAKNDKVQICVVETDAEPDINKVASPARYRSTIARTQRDIYAVTAMKIPAGDVRASESAISDAFSIARYAESVCLILEEQGASIFIDLQSALIHPSEFKPLIKPTETLFSFNSYLAKSGRCPKCDGLGETDNINLTALICDPSLPLAYGGLSIPFDTKTQRYKYFPPLSDELAGFLISRGFGQFSCWKDLGPMERQFVMNGHDELFQPISVEGKPKGKKKSFVGIAPRVELALAGESSAATALFGLRYRTTCSECAGSRLCYPARRVFIDDISLDTIYGFSISTLFEWLASVQKRTVGFRQTAIATLCKYLLHCNNLGLGHLPLLRSTISVSGGEGQRLRIARGLVTRVAPAAYVLDEPTRGLHPIDSSHLLDALRNLLMKDTAVIVVDHNPVIVEGVDHLVELGPGGGPCGGQIIYQGKPKEIQWQIKTKKATTSKANVFPGWISIEEISFRNIIHQSVRIPLGAITCFTGVSGSGKTTVVRDVLRPALDTWLQTKQDSGVNYKKISITGSEISRVLHIPQLALTDNPRSLLLTYLGLAEDFRNWFSRESHGDELGVRPAQLSPNTTEGCCPTCKGLGHTALDGSRRAMPCGACNGSGLHPTALIPVVQNRNFTAWLDLPVSQIQEESALPLKVRMACSLLSELGLGHVSLGRRVPTLSGGESQRLRITSALLDFESAKNGKKDQHLVFLLDEPAAGLHIADIVKLFKALHRIVEGQRHTVILVEHSLFMIERADWIVEMGPGAARDGGKILFQGEPSDLKKNGSANSPTRKALLGELPVTANTRPHLSPIADQSALVIDPAMFMKLTEEDSDVKDDILPPTVLPAFILDGEGTSGGNHDLLSLIGAALPLYQIFAGESAMPSGSPYSNEEQLKSDVRLMASRCPDALIGWFPATWQATLERLTSYDVRRSIENHLSSGAWGWFDGERVNHKKPGRGEGGAEISSIRMLICPEIDIETSISHALAFGDGWLSVISPKSKKIIDFSLRAITLNPVMAGMRWQVPQIFDRNSDLAPCKLCHGTGSVDSIDESLVIADPQWAVSDLSFYTTFAGEVLKSALRKSMLPALTRLAQSGIIDLSMPYDKLDREHRSALWFGYPYKRFLAPGGKPEIKGDWYRWRGVVKYILQNVWSASDRGWSEAVIASRNTCSCPECYGSGLGWEARSRRIGNISLQDILSTWEIGRLHAWIEKYNGSSDSAKAVTKLKQSLNLAVTTGLKDVICGSRVASLTTEQRLVARMLACNENELYGATVVVRVLSEQVRLRMVQALNSIQKSKSSSMQWIFELHG